MAETEGTVVVGHHPLLKGFHLKRTEMGRVSQRHWVKIPSKASNGLNQFQNKKKKKIWRSTFNRIPPSHPPPHPHPQEPRENRRREAAVNELKAAAVKRSFIAVLSEILVLTNQQSPNPGPDFERIPTSRQKNESYHVDKQWHGTDKTLPKCLGWKKKIGPKKILKGS